MLRADGGATANLFLMQLQADLIGCPVEVAADADATALGAAGLAGLAVGTWSSREELASHVHRGERYEPRWQPDEVTRRGRSGRTQCGACSPELHPPAASRIVSSALRRIRETCICERPRRFAISSCVRSTKNRR